MKKFFTNAALSGWLTAVACAFLYLAPVRSFSQSYNFKPSGLKGIKISNPTSLQFGPDGRLYVSQQNGVILAYTIKRNGASDYTATATETINIINSIPNHNDDGTLNPTITKRQITSILVTGSNDAPILYVTSSDSRIGGPSGDLNLDTNSSILSKLTKTKDGWEKVDLIRGFPRSEENHSLNGMQLDEKTNTLYVTVGGLTNAGAPSTNFAYLTEYAWAASVVAVDLAALDAMPTKGSGDTKYKYDLPTIDDPTRENNADGSDVNDPFGGNDGLNQAKITKDGPVKLYATGFRNAYDLVITKTPGKTRRLYTVDNGPNQGWGGGPDNEGKDGKVTSKYVKGEPGSTGAGINDPQVNNLDGFHYIGNLDTYVAGSYYGGHPNPIRANPSGAGLYTRTGSNGIWRSSKSGSSPLPADWPPVPVDMANPVEGDYQNPGEADKSLLTFPTSTNGLAEYTASNFNNALKGSILAACWNGKIYLVKPNDAGNGILNEIGDSKLIKDEAFAANFGSQPLDITAQGDGDIFPGSIWSATYGADAITIFEPTDFAACTGEYSTLVDDDADGYSNADEVDNKTDPCSAASVPADFDGDKISDLNDDDDDNDGIKDNADLFVIDNKNGLSTSIPLAYDLFNNDPGTGFFGLGFNGLMTNKKSDNEYLKLYDEDNLIAGGAVGAFSIVKTTSGDALGAQNNQDNAFQFGINVNSKTAPFTVKSRLLGSFFNNKPQDGQSQGIYIGTGDQDNYLKIAINANGGKGGIQVISENAGTAKTTQLDVAGTLAATTVDLFLSVDPATGIVQPKYAIDGGPETNAGDPIKLAGNLLTALQGTPALAVGIISTSGKAAAFTATWDYVNITTSAPAGAGTWTAMQAASGEPLGREENAYIQVGDKFYLLGGRGKLAVQVYDPAAKTWTNKSVVPMELHHFQAVTMEGLIYVIGAFTGNYPREKPVPNVYIYNPATDKWTKGITIPEARQRGSAGVVVYNKKIYIAGGILDGHWTGHVSWLDEYDPTTNTWKQLADAPRARDHFHAAVVNNKIYIAGGRRSSASTNQTFSLTVPEVDVYDFSSGKWTTLPEASNIPTQRAGAGAAVLNNELIVIGGESPQPVAHNETEALNVTTNSWRKLANLKQGRHGSQVIVNNNGIYIATGAGNQGGSPLLTNQEAFYLSEVTVPNGTALKQSNLSSVTTLDFGKSAEGVVASRTVKLTNTTGSQAIVITSIDISGDNAFTVSSPESLPFVLPVGASIEVDVKFTPAGATEQTASLKIVHSGLEGTNTIAVKGQTGSGQEEVLYRINSGGPALTLDGKAWAADQYFNGGKIYTNTKIGDIGNTTSDELFKTERSSDSLFSYRFPVTAKGVYKVKLYFAEIYWGATGGAAGSNGKRVFDVNVEGGDIELADLDIYKETGAMKALVKTVSVLVNDGQLDIDFIPKKDQPKISGIEVISLAGEVQKNVAANKDLLYFFSQQAGSVSQRQVVTITNNSDADIDITGITITGKNAVEFVHDAPAEFILAKGASRDISVSFKPVALGARVAKLQLTYEGSDAPLEVLLTGEGTDNSMPVSEKGKLAVAYPNPNRTGVIQVGVSKEISGSISYQLVSATGALLAKGEYHGASGGDVLTLDLSRFMTNAGVYYLQVQGENRYEWIKLVHE